MRLAVELYGVVVGTLEGDSKRWGQVQGAELRPCSVLR